MNLLRLLISSLLNFLFFYFRYLSFLPFSWPFSAIRPWPATEVVDMVDSGEDSEEVMAVDLAEVTEAVDLAEGMAEGTEEVYRELEEDMADSEEDTAVVAVDSAEVSAEVSVADTAEAALTAASKFLTSQIDNEMIRHWLSG